MTACAQAAHPFPRRFRPAVALRAALAALAAGWLALVPPARAQAAEPPPAPAVAVPYYVAEAGASRGPLGLDVLLGEIRDGKVQPWTLVWKPGLSAWIKAAALPELGEALAAATPRPPPPPPQPPAPPAAEPAGQVYFVAEGTGSRGPLTEADLIAALAAGEVGRGTLVWWPGAPAWTPAADVPALAGAFAATPPAVPAGEAMRRFMLGTWAFAPPAAAGVAARTTIAFAADMTYSGDVVVALPGLAPATRHVTGAWSISDAGADRFALGLAPAGGVAATTRLRVVDGDTLADGDGGTARRIAP